MCKREDPSLNPQSLCTGSVHQSCLSHPTVASVRREVETRESCETCRPVGETKRTCLKLRQRLPAEVTMAIVCHGAYALTVNTNTLEISTESGGKDTFKQCLKGENNSCNNEWKRAHPFFMAK